MGLVDEAEMCETQIAPTKRKYLHLRLWPVDSFDAGSETAHSTLPVEWGRQHNRSRSKGSQPLLRRLSFAGSSTRRASTGNQVG